MTGGWCAGVRQAGLVLPSGEPGSADPETVSTSSWSRLISHETEDGELQGLAWSQVTQGSSVALMEPRGRADWSVLQVIRGRGSLRQAGPQGTMEASSLSLFPGCSGTGEVPHRPKKLRGDPAGPAISPKKAHHHPSPTRYQKARSPSRPLCPHSCALGESTCSLPRVTRPVCAPQALSPPHTGHTRPQESRAGMARAK